jgi:hypothetical protein
MLAEVGIAARELAPAFSSCVSYFGSALRLDEPEKRRSRALVLACSGWVPVTQPSVAPLRAVFSDSRPRLACSRANPKHDTQLENALADNRGDEIVVAGAREPGGDHLTEFELGRVAVGEINHGVDVGGLALEPALQHQR